MILPLVHKVIKVFVINFSKLKNLDQAVHAKSTDVPRGCLDVQEDQSREKLQRNDEDLQLQINNVKPHTIIKSFFLWKSKPKITFIVMK